MCTCSIFILGFLLSHTPTRPDSGPVCQSALAAVLSQFPVSWSCWQRRVGRLPFLEGPDASCNDPPPVPSPLHWSVRRVESLISYHTVCGGSHSRNQEILLLCRSPMLPLSCALLSEPFIPFHVFCVTHHFFPPTCPFLTVHFYIVSFWSCLLDLGECFQSPASGRQNYIYHGIYSFALYILFLSSSQTSSSTSSSSSSASISPASTPCLWVHWRESPIAHRWQRSGSGPSASVLGSVCFVNVKKNRRERASVQSSLFLTRTPTLHGTIFTSLLNGRFCGSLSQWGQQLLHRLLHAGLTEVIGGVERGDSEHEWRSKRENREWKSSPSKEERQKGMKERYFFVRVHLLLLSKYVSPVCLSFLVEVINGEDCVWWFILEKSSYEPTLNVPH